MQCVTFWCVTDAPVLLAYLGLVMLLTLLRAWLYWQAIDELVQDWYWENDWESWDWE